MAYQALQCTNGQRALTTPPAQQRISDCDHRATATSEAKVGRSEHSVISHNLRSAVSALSGAFCAAASLGRRTAIAAERHRARKPQGVKHALVGITYATATSSVGCGRPDADCGGDEPARAGSNTRSPISGGSRGAMPPSLPSMLSSKGTIVTAARGAQPHNG